MGAHSHCTPSQLPSPLSFRFWNARDREFVSPAGEPCCQNSIDGRRDKVTFENLIASVPSASRMSIEFENMDNSFRNLTCNHYYVPSAIEHIESKFPFLLSTPNSLPIAATADPPIHCGSIDLWTTRRSIGTKVISCDQPRYSAVITDLSRRSSVSLNQWIETTVCKRKQRLYILEERVYCYNGCASTLLSPLVESKLGNILVVPWYLRLHRRRFSVKYFVKERLALRILSFQK